MSVLSVMPITILPEHELLKDRYWRGLLFLFSTHAKLQKYFNTKFFDLETGDVDTETLKNISRPWSNSERFMLDLALHMYNEDNEVNLSDMDYLDTTNKELALSAIRYRFG